MSTIIERINSTYFFFLSSILTTFVVQSCGSTVRLIDRPVGITLLRAVASVVDALDANAVADTLTALPRALAAAAADGASKLSGSSSAGNERGSGEKGVAEESGLGTAWGLYLGVLRAPTMPEHEFQVSVRLAICAQLQPH
jgi:hypothetical protein